MAKPRKLKREEAEASFVECECGVKQTSDLVKCKECGIARCDVCMPWGSDTACLDCIPEPGSDLDEVDF